MPIVSCRVCKNEFYAKPNWLKRGWGKYCSPKCQHEAAKRGKSVCCYSCGKKIWRMPNRIKRAKSKKFFCSKSCQTLWRNSFFSGPRHPNWRGGESVKYEKLLIRSGVKQTCKLCDLNDKRVLSVHHVDNNHRNNDVNNLVWLCFNCHHLAHHYIKANFK